MEFKEVRCINCSGMLHVPEDLNKIICMYCGKEFFRDQISDTAVIKDRSEIATKEKQLQQLWNKGDSSFIVLAEQILETENYNYLANFLLGSYYLPKILLEHIDMMESFKINLYEEAFETYKTQSENRLMYIERACAVKEGQRDQVLTELVSYFISDIEKGLSSISAKKQKEDYLQDLKMVSALYMIPMILELKFEISDGLADEIMKQWNHNFMAYKYKKGYYAEIVSGFRKKGFCYITTAVCESLGKSEDCYELYMFRWFRDYYLKLQEKGEELVLEYYKTAPYIVFAINKLKKSADIYKRLWSTYLSVCLTMLEEEKYEECMEHYKTMVYELKDRYNS